MLSYETIFSRYRGYVDDPKELALDLNEYTEVAIERLHMTVANVRVRKKFASIKLHDDIMQIEYKLTNSLDEDADDEYVSNLFALGMAIMWLKPKVDSARTTATFIGGKEEKKILDNHKYNIERLHSLEVELQKMLRDRGYMYNSYLSEV